MKKENRYFNSLDDVLAELQRRHRTDLIYKESLATDGGVYRRRVCIPNGKEVAQCTVGDTRADKWTVYPKPGPQVFMQTRVCCVRGAIPIDRAFRNWVKTARDEDTWQGAYQSILDSNKITEDSGDDIDSLPDKSRKRRSPGI